MKHPLSTEALVDFLGKMRPYQRYDYLSPTCCPIAQHLRTAYGRVAFVGNKTFHIGNGGERQPLPEGWDHIVGDQPRTYGAAHERAKEMLK